MATGDNQTEQKLAELSTTKKKQLGDKIRELRNAKGLTQSDLADQIVTPSMISQIETGKAFPSISVLSQIATRLGVTYDSLVADVKNLLSTNLQYKNMKVLKERGSYEYAIQLCDELLSSQDMMNENTTEISIDKAECLMYLNRQMEARDVLAALLNTEKEKAEPSIYTLSQVFNMIGSAYLLEHNLIDACANYSIALNYTVNMDEPDIIVGLINYNLGRTYEYTNDIEKALYHYDIASDILKVVEADNTKMANLYYAYAISYEKVGNLRIAEEYMTKALALYQANRDYKMVNRVRESAAYLIDSKRDKYGARNKLLTCIKQAREFDDSTHVAYIFAKLLVLALDEDKTGEADLFHSEIMNINYFSKDMRAAFIERVIARFHFEVTKNYEKTITYANRSAELFDRIGMKREAGLSLKLVIQTYEVLDEKDLALDASKRVISLIE